MKIYWIFSDWPHISTELSKSLCNNYFLTKNNLLFDYEFNLIFWRIIIKTIVKFIFNDLFLFV